MQINANCGQITELYAQYCTGTPVWRNDPRQTHCDWEAARMDDEFDKALHTLAALQIKRGIPAILLSMQTAGDVIAKLHNPEGNTFANYARVHRDTKRMVRLRSS